MSETKTITLTRHDTFPTMPPTKKCLVCNTMENPNATICDLSIPWLCPKCKRKLRKLVEEQT